MTHDWVKRMGTLLMEDMKAEEIIQSRKVPQY